MAKTMMQTVTPLELTPQDQAGKECPVCGCATVDRGEYYDRLEDYCQRCGLLVKYRSKLHDVKKEPGDQLALIRKLERENKELRAKDRSAGEILTAILIAAKSNSSADDGFGAYIGGMTKLWELWGIE